MRKTICVVLVTLALSLGVFASGPSGTATCYDANNNQLGANGIVENGAAGVDFGNALPKGTNPGYYCKYSGDANFAPSQSEPFALTVVGNTTTTVVCTPNPSNQGQDVQCTLTIAQQP